MVLQTFPSTMYLKPLKPWTIHYNNFSLHKCLLHSHIFWVMRKTLETLRELYTFGWVNLFHRHDLILELACALLLDSQGSQNLICYHFLLFHSSDKFSLGSFCEKEVNVFNWNCNICRLVSHLKDIPISSHIIEGVNMWVSSFAWPILPMKNTMSFCPLGDQLSVHYRDELSITSSN